MPLINFKTIIYFRLFGPNTETEWTVEGRRIIPLFPRLKGRTAFTTFANSLSLTTAIANERQSPYQRKREGLTKCISVSYNYLRVIKVLKFHMSHYLQSQFRLSYLMNLLLKSYKIFFIAINNLPQFFT